jgi:hypothetical protein
LWRPDRGLNCDESQSGQTGISFDISHLFWILDGAPHVPEVEGHDDGRKYNPKKPEFQWHQSRFRKYDDRGEQYY